MEANEAMSAIQREIRLVYLAIKPLLPPAHPLHDAVAQATASDEFPTDRRSSISTALAAIDARKGELPDTLQGEINQICAGLHRYLATLDEDPTNPAAP